MSMYGEPMPVSEAQDAEQPVRDHAEAADRPQTDSQ